MQWKHRVLGTLVAATFAVPIAAHADHDARAGVRAGVGSASVSTGASVRTGSDRDRARVENDVDREDASIAAEPIRQTIRVDRVYDVPLESGCTYHATVNGTVRPVAVRRGESAELQRLRPDLRVASTIRCPGSTEAHIQERAVRSTGVTREEFEHLLALNASVERMQNTGRCMYLPEFAFSSRALDLHDVRYLCPSQRGGSRGGGPNHADRDLENR
jgi:hypothetical protein